MNRNISISGMVKNITVNGVDHQQDKKNTIVDQGLNTLVSMSSKAAINYVDAQEMSPICFLQSDFKIPISYSNNTYMYYRAMPAIGCMFGTGDSATTNAQTALVNPIGSVDDLKSFGFHRSDLCYTENFLVYERNNEREIHHLKYVWIATTDATIKEIGIYSFLMPEEQITAGFTSTQVNDLNNFTNRKLFSRCVLANPVEVEQGDVVIAYYDVTLTSSHAPGSIVSTDSVFGMPAVTMAAPLNDNVKFYCNSQSNSTNNDCTPIQYVDANGELKYYYTYLYNKSIKSYMSLLTHLFPVMLKHSGVRSACVVFQACPLLCSNNIGSGSVMNISDVSDRFDTYNNYSTSKNYSNITPLGISTKAVNGFNNFTYATSNVTVGDHSNTLHTVSKSFANTNYIDGTKRLILIYDNYEFILNATVDDNNTIIQDFATLPQNCTLTFDVTTTLTRG